jgi:predicted transcriptional regulator
MWRFRRLAIRISRDEIAALDYLAEKWDASRSQVVRSMIVGAALAQLDRLDDAWDAVEPSFDDVLPFPGLEVK